jgi:integrase
MAGVNPAAVQRILRHSDPRITTETYGHLEPNYLRSEIDRLRFGTAPAESLSSGSHAVTSDVSQFVTTSSPLGTERPAGPSTEAEIPEGFSAASFAGWTGLEPAASGVTGRRYNQA